VITSAVSISGVVKLSTPLVSTTVWKLSLLCPMKMNRGMEMSRPFSPFVAIWTSLPSTPSLALNEYCRKDALSLPGMVTPRKVLLPVVAEMP